MRSLPLCLTILLLWTNPPDADLAQIRFHVVQAGSFDTTTTVGYFGRCYDEICTPIVHPGEPDSVFFSVPCFSVPTAWYIWATAIDTTGINESEHGNTIRVIE